ncbi:MAG: hypothetical protein AAGF33_16665 [Pseudomonadota bacterium]
MNRSHCSFATLLALGIGVNACGGSDEAATETAAVDAPEAVVEAQVLETAGPRADTNMTTSIDWQAARADLAGADDRSDSVVQVQSGGTSPPVPVLLPTGIVVPQSEGGGPVYRPTSDGYFATYPGAQYDIVVNGTNQVATINGEASTRNEIPVFTETIAGAQVAISRYGADYLIEFECNQLNGQSASCIEEAEALSVAERLVVVGSR